MTREKINQQNKKKRIGCIIWGIILTIAGILCFTIEEVGLYLGIACLGVALILFILANKLFGYLTEKEFDRIYSHQQKTPALSPEDQKKLQLAKSMYEHGQISFLEYDAYASQLKNERSYAQTFGLDNAIQASNKLEHERRKQEARKEAEQAIAMGTIIGGAVGGSAGAVAGAVMGKQRAEEIMEDFREENKL